MRTPTTLLSLLVALTFSGVAAAIPMVTLDVDPGTAGVQTDRTVALSSQFDVDVVVTDVGPLNLYDFDLGFTSSQLSALDVFDGGFLLAPTFESIRDLSAPAVQSARSTLGLGAASGSGVLATVRFSADALGVTSLVLSDVNLAAPFGEPLAFQLGCCGRIVVEGASTAVPEPGAALLFVLGLLLVARRAAP